MATSRVYLQGGPCNGRTVSADQIQGGLVGYILCRGHYYLDSGRTRRNGNAIFIDSGTTAPQPPGSTNLNAPRAHSGWRDLRRSVNRTMPHALNRASALTRSALRATSHGRKVKL